jgi:hypothetical protein
LTSGHRSVQSIRGKVALVGFSLVGTGKHVSGREDWALLSIACSDRSLLPIQLQKALYLLGRRYPAVVGSSFYQFRTVSAGHFSEEIYADVDLLSDSGLIKIDQTANDASRRYKAKPAGEARAKALTKTVRPEVIDYLKSVVSWASARTVDQLRRATVDVPIPVDLASKSGRPLPPR